MAIKQTDIRLMEINARLRKISDKLQEIVGEKKTLFFKMEHDDIHPILFMLKVQALDFEAMLLQEETEMIKGEYEATQMVAEMGLDFSKEDF
jgi:predicted nuclease with TOPRIM domain